MVPKNSHPDGTTGEGPSPLTHNCRDRLWDELGRICLYKYVQCFLGLGKVHEDVVTEWG